MGQHAVDSSGLTCRSSGSFVISHSWVNTEPDHTFEALRILTYGGLCSGEL